MATNDGYIDKGHTAVPVTVDLQMKNGKATATITPENMAAFLQVCDPDLAMLNRVTVQSLDVPGNQGTFGISFSHGSKPVSTTGRSAFHSASGDHQLYHAVLPGTGTVREQTVTINSDGYPTDLINNAAARGIRWTDACDTLRALGKNADTSELMKGLGPGIVTKVNPLDGETRMLVDVSGETTSCPMSRYIARNLDKIRDGYYSGSKLKQVNLNGKTMGIFKRDDIHDMARELAESLSHNQKDLGIVVSPCSSNATNVTGNAALHLLFERDTVGQVLYGTQGAVTKERMGGTSAAVSDPSGAADDHLDEIFSHEL